MPVRRSENDCANISRSGIRFEVTRLGRSAVMRTASVVLVSAMMESACARDRGILWYVSIPARVTKANKIPAENLGMVDARRSVPCLNVAFSKRCLLSLDPDPFRDSSFPRVLHYHSMMEETGVIIDH